MGRWTGLLLCALALVLLALALAAPAHAQDAPPALTPEQSQQHDQAPAVDLGAAGRETAHAIFSGLGAWLEDYLGHSGPAVLMRGFLAALGWLGQRLLAGLDDAGGHLDLLTRLDPDVTLGDPTVLSVWGAARGLFTVLLGLGAVLTGYLVLLRFGGTSAVDVGSLLPRVAIGALLVNGSLDLLRVAVEAADGVGHYLARDGAAGFARDVAGQLGPTEAGGLLLLLAVMAALLFVMRVLMHATLSVLAMTAPLALAAWVVPQWSGWFWRWANLLGALLAGHVLQVLLLAAGGSMLARAVAQAGGPGSDGGRLVGGLVAFGVLGMAVGAPAMVGLGVVGGSTLALARRAYGVVTQPWTARAKPRPQRGQGHEDERFADIEDTTTWGLPGPERRSQPRTIIYTRLPSLPPTAGGASARPALPPPDYLRE